MKEAIPAATFGGQSLMAEPWPASREHWPSQAWMSAWAFVDLEDERGSRQEADADDAGAVRH